MINAQENKINTKEFEYMSYNKLNIFMTILLLGFSISFAVLGYRVKPEAVWWGIFLLCLPLFTLAPSIKNIGAAVVDAVMNNPNILKISIGILLFITIVCIFLLAFNVSFWFFLFFVPLLYFLLRSVRSVYTYVIYLIQEHPIIFAGIIGILSIVGLVYLLIV